jgi:predicted lysophospholipase L1 biosynthesis ABC-type transport system permease subunit
MTYFPSFPTATAKRAVRFLLHLERPSAITQLRVSLPALAPGWAMKEPVSLEDRVREQSAPARASVEVLSGFSLAALLQAGFGLFSVLSFLAATRRKEWAIRRGLGAEAPTLIGHVLSHALPPVACGLLAGFGLAWAARRALESLLLSLNPLEPLAILATLVGVLLLALAASLLPALQALRIQPAELLRSE